VEHGAGEVPLYGFTHALVRQALYAGTSGPRRRAAARSRGGGTRARAGRAADRGARAPPRLAGPAGDADKAIEWSVAAGQQAAARFAWDDAAEHWDGAVAVMARVGGLERGRAGLLVALGDLMVLLGDLGRQLAYLEQAVALYDALGDAERAAQVHSRLGMAHGLMDSVEAEHLDTRAAFRHFDAARAVLEHGPPRRARGHLHVGIATAYTYRLQVPSGLEAAHRAMEIAEAVGDEVLWSSAPRRTGGTPSSAAGWPRASPSSSGPSTSPTATAGRSWRSWRRTSAGSSPGASVRLTTRRPLRAPAPAAVRRARRLPAPDRRRDRALPCESRGARGGASAARRGPAELDQPLPATGAPALGRGPGGGRGARA
jgi:hypothetical protein